MNHDKTTPAGDSPARGPRGGNRDRQGLLEALALVDAHGWDSEPATALLTQIRYELIRPLTIAIGLRGTAAAQAEASAWETVWLKLCDPHLRCAASPWGVIWQTARRAVLAEVLAARWGTQTRRAWEHNAEERTGRRARPIRLEPLLASGFDTADPSPPPEPAPGTPVASSLQLAADALTQAGWDSDEARRIVAEIALMDEALGHGATVVGWRPLAAPPTKGEHGIAILAPCIYRAAPGETAAADPQPDVPSTARRTEPTVPDPDDTPRQLRGFKVVHVFDVTQTEGEPLPDIEPAHLTGAEPEGLWNHLAALTYDDGYLVERGPCGPGANGYTDFTTRLVRIRDDVEPAQAAKTLAHELGHIRADHEHRFTEYATSAACRGRAEVEAESIAYLITARAGLDSAAYSVPYLASWSNGDADLLRESMTRVVSVARGVTNRSTATAETRPIGPSWLSLPTTASADTARVSTASPSAAVG